MCVEKGSDMSGSMRVDVAQVNVFLKNANLTANEMLTVEKPGALTIVNTQRTLVPKDTHATELSISPHIQEASEKRVVDLIGPETDYSTYIEFGVISKPNYPIQPFVRPSAFGANKAKIFKAIEAAFAAVVRKKYG